jgi:hypothetical protein
MISITGLSEEFRLKQYKEKYHEITPSPTASKDEINRTHNAQRSPEIVELQGLLQLQQHRERDS